MKQQVLPFLKKGLLFLVLVFLVDRGIGSLIQYYLQKEKQGDTSVATHALTRASEDVYIFGSSRASHHYVPKLIKQTTNLSAFNVGRDGMTLPYYEALLKGVLSYHTPKVIILDLNLGDFTIKENKENVVVATLLPYIGVNSVVGKILKKSNLKEYWKAEVSHLYRYNSLPASILQHNMGIGQKNESGYEPLKGNKLRALTDTLEENNDYHEDPGLIKTFENFVMIARSKGAKLYVIVSPNAKKRKYSSKVTASKILAKHGLKLYDYSEFAQKDKVALFYDGSHLNDVGAKKFTQAIVQNLLRPDTSPRDTQVKIVIN